MTSCKPSTLNSIPPLILIFHLGLSSSPLLYHIPSHLLTPLPSPLSSLTCKKNIFRKTLEYMASRQNLMAQYKKVIGWVTLAKKVPKSIPLLHLSSPLSYIFSLLFKFKHSYFDIMRYHLGKNYLREAFSDGTPFVSLHLFSPRSPLSPSPSVTCDQSLSLFWLAFLVIKVSLQDELTAAPELHKVSSLPFFCSFLSYPSSHSPSSLLPPPSSPFLLSSTSLPTLALSHLFRSSQCQK